MNTIRPFFINAILLHYRLFMGTVTSFQVDDADIYLDVSYLQSKFEKFLRLVPKHVSIPACNDGPVIRDMLNASNFDSETYELQVEQYWNVSEINDTRTGIHAVFAKGAIEVASGVLLLIGRHNVLYALAAMAAVEKVGSDPPKAEESPSAFRVVVRLQEVSDVDSNVIQIDNFAHHHQRSVKLWRFFT